MLQENKQIKMEVGKKTFLHIRRLFYLSRLFYKSIGKIEMYFRNLFFHNSTFYFVKHENVLLMEGRFNKMCNLMFFMRSIFCEK